MLQFFYLKQLLLKTQLFYMSPLHLVNIILTKIYYYTTKALIIGFYYHRRNIF
jgi:hypothetical protein